MKVEYLLSDHLGSTSITTDKAGTKVSEMRYKPWGEVRSWWTSSTVTAPSYALTKYTLRHAQGTAFTGQYSYMDNPSTSAVTEGFGLMHYGARMYDPALGRFTSADTIVPGGVQGYDRYAYVNNSPVKYTDPTGHESVCGQGNSDPECGNLGNSPLSHPKPQKPPKPQNPGKDDEAGSPLSCASNNYECLVREKIDGEFNPFNPFIPDNGADITHSLYYNQLALEAYGGNLDQYAALGINNPLTVKDFTDAGVPIEWIEMMNPSRRSPGQAFFIKEMRLDPNKITNYEPNYLNAMMEAHPIGLQKAKDSYYSMLIEIQGSPQVAYEWMLMNKELIGTDIIGD